MKYERREMEGPLRKAQGSFPATVLTGPRRAGKTWLLRHLFPAAEYVLLEDPDVVAPKVDACTAATRGRRAGPWRPSPALARVRRNAVGPPRRQPPFAQRCG